MKTIIKSFGLMAALLVYISMGQACAQDNNGVSFQTFYDQLASEGNWVQTSDYGYVFQPTESNPNWQPYTYGHWVNTDSGMMWDSDESFGWATYHYGRWVNLADYGWVWVPGYTWAPAWVSWRDGDDYVGWAPLPPDTFLGIDFYDPFWNFGYGFHIGGDCDVAFGIGAGWYNFCPVGYIGDPYAYRHFADRRDNFAIINGTHNVTNINVNNRAGVGQFARVHEGGPSVATLNARSRTPIQHVSLTEASTLAGNGRMHGNSFSVYAPNVNPKTLSEARPREVAATLGKMSVNRGTDINRPLAVNSHVRQPGATAGQIRAAHVADGNRAASARIATANTPISRPLTQSLTSLRPKTAGTATTERSQVADTAKAETRHDSSPAVAAESRYTGQSATVHAAAPERHYASSGEYSPAATGEQTHRTERVTHESNTQAYHQAERTVRTYAPMPGFHGGGAQRSFTAGRFAGGGGGHSAPGGGGAHASAGGGGGGHAGGGGGHR